MSASAHGCGAPSALSGYCLYVKFRVYKVVYRGQHFTKGTPACALFCQLCTEQPLLHASSACRHEDRSMVAEGRDDEPDMS